MLDKPLLAPENHQTWTVAAFIIALLALVIALAGIYRINVTVMATQLQVLSLNQKVDRMQQPTARAPADAITAPAPEAAK